MIAYISDNGNGPGPYSKHGLAISLRNLKSPDRTNLFLIEELEKVDTYLSEYQKVAPSWTQWYVPRFKDFDLIFDAFGGTKYSNKPHYTTQPWDYGRLNDFMESTNGMVKTRFIMIVLLDTYHRITIGNHPVIGLMFPRIRTHHFCGYMILRVSNTYNGTVLHWEVVLYALYLNFNS